VTPCAKLHSLRIQNLALIEQAQLDLHTGLNVLSGETGAGKTMLAKSLEVLLGARAPKSVVRPGADHAYIEALFDLPEDFTLATDDDELAELLADSQGDQLSIARRIAAEGKSRCLINGRTVTLDALRAVANQLVAFYGQHEGRDLLLDKVQMQILDSFDDKKGKQLHLVYSADRLAALRAERNYQHLLQEQTQDSRQLDLARYELGELEEVTPQGEGEEDQLHGELQSLSGAVEGAAACSKAHSLLSTEDGAGAAIYQAQRELENIGGPVAEMSTRLESVLAEITDLENDLGRLSDSWEADPAKQAEIEGRLSLLNSLARKHGVAIDQLPEVKQRLQEQITKADQAPQTLQAAQQAAQQALEKANKSAISLSKWRKKQAPKLAERITGVLEELAMPGAKFDVQLVAYEGKGISALQASGAESVQFLLQANPGLPAEPLHRVASGGEISRLMLALIAEARPDEQAILVLDEPDVGLGGHTAHGVAARLQDLAQRSQLVVISHLPQIAARADRILCIEKQVSKDQTVTQVRTLEGEEEILDELCRMAGHKADDPAAREAARSLRQV
jgi:DNA repair protein RecN (Recombination protein N)